jgi:hypothetical protein
MNYFNNTLIQDISAHRQPQQAAERSSYRKLIRQYYRDG